MGRSIFGTLMQQGIVAFQKNHPLFGNFMSKIDETFFFLISAAMKHLDENGLGYWEHWWRAMKLSGALFIHAFLPNVLSDYASKELHNE